MGWSVAYRIVVSLAVVAAPAGLAKAEPMDAAPIHPQPAEPAAETIETDEMRAQRVEAEPYAPLGLRSGVFAFYPSVEVAAVVSDNPDQASSGGEAGLGLRLAPELVVKSEWVRHGFELRAAGERTDYADRPELQSIEGEAESRLKLDIRRNTAAELLFSATQSQSSASASEVPDSAAGKRTDHELTAAAELRREAGWIEAAVTAELSRLAYGDVALADGSSEENSDRNYLEASTAIRVMPGQGAGIRPFAEIELSRRIHDEKIDRNGLERDSFGLTLRGGAALEIGALWSGTAGLQYDHRRFADDAFTAFSGLGAFAELAWRPSRLTSVSLSATSGFEESASAGVSGYRTQDVEITLNQALRENLAVELRAAGEYSDAQGGSSRSLTLEGGGEIVYALSRALSLTGSLTHTRYRSFTDDSDYRETEITAGMTISR